MQSLTRCGEARVDSLLLTRFFFPLSLPLKNSNFKMKKILFPRIEREEKKKKSMPRVHETIPYIFYISFDENFFIQYVYATYLLCDICSILFANRGRIGRNIVTSRGYRRSIYNISQSQTDQLLLVAYTTLNPIFRGMSWGWLPSGGNGVSELHICIYTWTIQRDDKKKMCTTGEGEMKKMSKSKRHSHLKAR